MVSASYTSDRQGYLYFQDSTFSRSIAATVTSTSTSITSAALFTPDATAFLGVKVAGTGIPANTIITAYTDASTMTLSNAATNSNATAKTFTGKTYYHLDPEASTTTLTMQPFTPSDPIPINATGAAALCCLECTTAGRLSVTYGYGI